MSRAQSITYLSLLLMTPAWAGPGEVFAGVAVYIIYTILAVSLVGWSLLVSVLARRKVELTAKVLQQRPLASFFMGLLSLGWLFLAGGIADKAGGGIGGLLVLVTLSILIFCALIGLPAILVGLGRRAAPLWDTRMNLPKELFLGALILFTAGGFPWLGQLLLLGVLIWSSGGAVLGFFAGDPADNVALRPSPEEQAGEE